MQPATTPATFYRVCFIFPASRPFRGITRRLWFSLWIINWNGAADSWNIDLFTGRRQVVHLRGCWSRHRRDPLRYRVQVQVHKGGGGFQENQVRELHVNCNQPASRIDSWLFLFLFSMLVHAKVSIPVLLRTPAVPLRYHGGLRKHVSLLSLQCNYRLVKFGWDPPRVKWP